MLFLNLHRLCLVHKTEVKRAINSEKPLEDPTQEQAKIVAVNSQLIPYGDYYDLEPVVFNFMAKLYEELLPLGLSILGEAYASMQQSYDKETRAGLSHYVPITPIPFDSDSFMDNLILLDSGFYEARDEYEDVSTTGLNYSGYKLLQTKELRLLDAGLDIDKVMAMELIGGDPKFCELAALLPHHIGAAVILDDGMKNIDVKPFNIKQELAGLQQHDIQIDDKFLPTHDEEIFVLVCVSGNESHITPSIIWKDELISYCQDVSLRKYTSDKDKDKYKKAKNLKIKAAEKSRKKKIKAAKKSRKIQRK